MLSLSILFIVIGISQVVGGNVGFIIMIIFGVLWLLPIPLAALFAPVKYIVRPSAIIVWRYGPKIPIPISIVTGVKPVELKKVMRTCAAGGAFGSYGSFYCKSLGSFRGYVSRKNRLVAIMTTKGTLFVVSPDDREGFIAAVETLLTKSKNDSADTTAKKWKF